MGVRGEQEALDFIPPAGAGTALPNAAQNVSLLTGVSSVAQATGSASGVIGVYGTWVTFIWISATAADTVRIRFGDANVGAATTSDLLIPPNTYVSWWCSPGMSHFRAILTGTGPGAFQWYRSNQ